jgi:hypothetical protein
MSAKFSVSRRNFIYLLSSVAVGISCQSSPAKNSKPTWQSIRSFKMKGDLKAFWYVYVGDHPFNRDQAIKHGFSNAQMLPTYADYPNNQKENIDDYLKRNGGNPWRKPPFFEKILKRNIKEVNIFPSNGNTIDSHKTILVHNIESAFEQDVKKLWANPAVRKSAKVSKFEDFAEINYRQQASWLSAPCKLSKQLHPQKPVGIYGVQLFNRDYWGFVKPSTPAKLEEKHSADLRLWKYIDPYVDFYIADVYMFYDLPDSIYYMAANIEENYRRSRNFGNKPLYAYLWLRFHEGTANMDTPELPDYLVEAAGVLPFFTGAKGIVLWGYEPKNTGQPYHNLPTFVSSLGRVADLSAKIAKAKLIIDRPAHKLWLDRQPLIRKFKVSKNEWIMLATNPWQSDQDTMLVTTNCGTRSVKLEIRGKHTEIYHLQIDSLKRISMR